MGQIVALKSRSDATISWILAAVTLVLALGAIFMVVRNPSTVVLAVVLGVLAVAARSLFWRLRRGSPRGSLRRRSSSSGPSTLANGGLVIAAIALLPIFAFVVLWVSLLVLIGVSWLLHIIGVV